MRRKTKHRKEGRGKRLLTALCAVLLVCGVLAVLGGVWVYDFARNNIHPEVDEALFAAAGQSNVTRLYYNAGPGKGIAESQHINGYYPAELKSQALTGTTVCQRISLESMPVALGNAFVAIEDKRYYAHDGVDWLRTAKAGANYLFHFDSRFGGSTITQQLIKNIGGENEFSPMRKLKEMLRAIRLDSTHTKEEILEAYLNVIPMGHGCVGVGSAAAYYFGKPPAELTVWECASLAAITNAPARYNPILHPEAHCQRRDLILDAMAEQGYLTAAEAELAKQRPVSTVAEARGEEKVYDWYTETVLSDVLRGLMTTYGYTKQAASHLLYSGGLSVYTLQDPEVQHTLEQYFSDPSHFPKQTEQGLQYAMAVIDPQTGYLLGVVGGVGQKNTNRPLNRAIDITRPPASALKPLALYAPALEEDLITQATVFDDVPVSFGSDPTKPSPWPRNSPNVYAGLCNVSDALCYSKNTVAVRLYQQLGAEKIYDILSHRLHFSSLTRRHTDAQGNTFTDLAAAPLALGQLTCGVTLRELTAGYATLARDGIGCSAESYVLVLDRDGNKLLENQPVTTRAFSASTARLTTDLLQGVVERGTAQEISLQKEMDVAGKTGTSGGNRDKWFVGYTPYLCAGIWCGYDDDRPVTGLSKSQNRIWDEVMTLLHRPVMQKTEELHTFSKEGLVPCRVCRDSGCLLTDTCALDPRGDRGVTLYFKPATRPTSSCRCHVKVLYDTETGGVASPHCDPAGGTLAHTALLNIPWRDFPIQVHVQDAEFVCRPLGNAEPGSWWGVPYFINTIPSGHFVGITDHGGGRQYNAYCYEHHLLHQEDMSIPLPPWPPDADFLKRQEYFDFFSESAQ